MSREKKHTPGPWKANSHDTDLLCVEQDNNDPLQICGLIPFESCATEDWISPEQRKANADLIAAAPELLKYLEASTKMLESNADNIGSDCVAELAELNNNVIAKAYGENQ